MHAIIEAATLQDWTGTIGEVVDEFKLFFDESGFHTAAVDPAQIGMIDTTLTRSAFESFDPDGGAVDDVAVIGIPYQDKFADMIGKADGGELIELRLNEDYQLEIGIGGRATITMSPLDPSTVNEEPDVSELGLPNSVEFGADVFGDAIGLTDLVSDHAHIEGRPNGDCPVAITADGDTDGVETTLDREQITDGSVDEKTDSMFAIDYLKRVQKAMNGAGEVELRFGDEMPIMLEFSPCDYASATMLLAPRLET